MHHQVIQSVPGLGLEVRGRGHRSCPTIPPTNATMMNSNDMTEPLCVLIALIQVSLPPPVKMTRSVMSITRSSKQSARQEGAVK